MILDLPRFIAAERAYWEELERVLDGLDRQPGRSMGLDEIQRFHYLYERCSADLVRMATFSAEGVAREHLESLVARAYGEIHSAWRRKGRVKPVAWFFTVFPKTFRRHLRLFAASVLITALGCAFGAFAVLRDPDAKSVLIPFGGLHGSPAERVRQEEHATSDRLASHHATFSAMLITNNIRVSVATLTLGVTWGVGTIIVLFFNGAILGAVSADYIRDGQAQFLFGWLLPHGAIEIPAILIAGQAGLLLASALAGWGIRGTRRERLRAVGGDLLTLVIGVAVLLVWAGVVESFLSQFHAPVIPYGLKIGFGLAELVLLAAFLGRAGAGESKT